MKKYRLLIMFLICTSCFLLVSVLTGEDGLSVSNLLTSAILGLVLSLIFHFFYVKRG